MLRSFLSDQEFTSALAELSEDLFLLLVDDKIVVSNEAPRYISAGVCRYRLE